MLPLPPNPSGAPISAGTERLALTADAALQAQIVPKLPWHRQPLFGQRRGIRLHRDQQGLLGCVQSPLVVRGAAESPHVLARAQERLQQQLEGAVFGWVGEGRGMGIG
jgi:hypothetical protein